MQENGTLCNFYVLYQKAIWTLITSYRTRLFSRSRFLCRSFCIFLLVYQLRLSMRWSSTSLLIFFLAQPPIEHTLKELKDEVVKLHWRNSGWGERLHGVFFFFFFLWLMEENLFAEVFRKQKKISDKIKKSKTEKLFLGCSLFLLELLRKFFCFSLCFCHDDEKPG